jgi:hypothetical protein
MSLIHNERLKLTATLLNTLAAATVVTGVIAPLAAVVLGVQAAGRVSTAIFVLAATIWFLFGPTLHFSARYVLGGLRP